MREVAVLAFLGLGTSLLLLAAVGILRMPDVFCRSSATPKAAVLGIGSILSGAIVHFGLEPVSARALATLAFLVITTPIAAYVIARAAYSTGVPLWEGTVRDEIFDYKGPEEEPIRRERAKALESQRAREVEEEA